MCSCEIQVISALKFDSHEEKVSMAHVNRMKTHKIFFGLIGKGYKMSLVDYFDHSCILE